MKKEKQYEKKLISIIVPVYNVEPYLRKCLDSIINQTYQNLDIIIVDDGSTDGSGQICDYYQSADRRIRVFHKKNEGLSSARNLGLQHAKGEFIGFVDSDDFIDLDMYESMLHEMDDDVDIVTCGRYICFPKEKHCKGRLAYFMAKRIKMNNVTAVEEFLKHEIISFSVCDKVFRKEVLEGAIFPYKRGCEDIPVTYKTIVKCRNIVNLGKPKYHNFHRDESLSRQEFYYRKIDYVIFTGEICKDIAIKYPYLLMQAEALYIMCVLDTIKMIQTCQNRLLYKDLENRLLKILRYMSIRILHNSFILPEKKRMIFKCLFRK